MASTCSSSRTVTATIVATVIAVIRLVAGSGTSAVSAALPQGTGVQTAAPKQATAPKKVKPAESWPSPEKLRERRLAAEARALFSNTDPVAFTLRADFKAVNRDRAAESTKRFPATLIVTGPDGQAREIPVELSTRGHARLSVRTCSVVPLRVTFLDKKLAAGTVFEGQDELKLVTHCQNTSIYEQYVLREYLAYRVFNLLTTRSYRARLAKGVYVDASPTAKAPDARWAMFIEDDSDVARRMEGRIAALQNRLFRHLDQDTLTRMMLLQYLVANSDVSIVKLHNVRIVQDSRGALYPLSFDFDYAGLVNTHYAVADTRFGITSVRERLYRGPCRTLDALEPFLLEFRAKKDEVLALYDSLPELDAGYIRSAKRFLEEFYETIGSPKTARRAFVDSCGPIAGM